MLDKHGMFSSGHKLSVTWRTKIVWGRLNKVSAVLLLIIFILVRLYNISKNNQAAICNRNHFDQRLQPIFLSERI